MAQNGSYRKIGGRDYVLKPRDYVVNIAHDAVAGTTATGIINIDPSSPFIMTDRFMADTNDPTTAAPGAVGLYEDFISVQDQANNYNWHTAPVLRSCFARDRTHGYSMPSEVMIAANTKLLVTLTNPAAAAAAGTMQVVLQGFSLYPA